MKHKWKQHGWLCVKCATCGEVADGDDKRHYDVVGCKGKKK